jgi:NADPH-dependent 2,4-dienoyl-CoA reductase/sulfur reductase-like enzyme
MADYQYLIIGAGMAADAAVRGILELDQQAKIALIGDEPSPPYNRPPLSKKLWKGKPLEGIWRKAAEQSAELFLGREAISIDPSSRTVRDDRGEIYTYDKLLLATGGTPRKLSFGGKDILYYRTLEDYLSLRELCGQEKKFRVIGGGFIGSEIAAALNMNGEKVALLFPEDGIGARIYPPEVSRYLTDLFREKGVEVMSGVNVTDLVHEKETQFLVTDKGNRIEADSVIAGIGLIPNVELARSAGLQVENGIVVDETLNTSDPHIYAAGDVAAFFQPALGRSMRVEHEDNANTMGMQAGRNMAGAHEPYHHLPYFYTDLFEVGYEAVGVLDFRMETFTDWEEPYKKGVIYYLEEGRVRGVLLWNVWDKIDAARALIAEPGPFKASDLTGRLG